MQKDNSQWREYFEQYCKGQVALDPEEKKLEKLLFGRKIYSSPNIYMKKWHVFEYKQNSQTEYNVFCERVNRIGNNKELVASFTIQETALAFALRLLLVSVGYIKRQGIVK